MTSTGKSKLAIYWSSTCGGCDLEDLNMRETLSRLEQVFELLFCPGVVDAKECDLDRIPDSGIEITLFNGAIGTPENMEIARLLRVKSRVLISYGVCSAEAGIPAPNALDRIYRLSDILPVDYVLPGCASKQGSMQRLLETLIQAQSPILQRAHPSVCDSCNRRRSQKPIERFYSPLEIIPDPEKCLLDQGLICMGITTRDGCGALCPKINLPCSGCYEPPACFPSQKRGEETRIPCPEIAAKSLDLDAAGSSNSQSPMLKILEIAPSV